MSRAPIAFACALAGMPAFVGGASSPGHAHQHGSVAARQAAASSRQADRAHRQVHVARRATARFRDVRRAERAGYEPAAECVDGMGFHYAHPQLAGDRRLDVRRPEILVYQRHHGHMRLVALEYFRADADQRLDTDEDRPRLFGRGFDGPMEGHEPGMPIHYDLHAWLVKHNPDGRFAQFNPRVSC
jgi:hypothetical protein